MIEPNSLAEKELEEGFIIFQKCHERAWRPKVGIAAKNFAHLFVIETTRSGVVLLLLYFFRHAVLKHISL